MKHATRIDTNTLEVGNDEGVPITLFAREDVRYGHVRSAQNHCFSCRIERA